MVVAVFGGFTVFKAYSFWVVKTFLNEINYYGGFNPALRELTDAELKNLKKVVLLHIRLVLEFKMIMRTMMEILQTGLTRKILKLI